MKLASVHTYIIMAPHKGTRYTPVGSNVSFRAKGAEGENVERIICTPRYTITSGTSISRKLKN